MLLQASVLQFTSDAHLDICNAESTHKLTLFLLAHPHFTHSPSALTQSTMGGKKRWSSRRMARIWSDEESESILTEVPANTKYPSPSQPLLFLHIVTWHKGLRDLMLKGEVLCHSKKVAEGSGFPNMETIT